VLIGCLVTFCLAVPFHSSGGVKGFRIK